MPVCYTLHARWDTQKDILKLPCAHAMPLAMKGAIIIDFQAGKPDYLGMNDATERNEKGQWAEGSSGNPAGRRGNGGWQDVATRINHWLEKPIAELEAIEEANLSTRDALIVARIKRARKDEGLQDFNAVFDRAYGKPRQEAKIEMEDTAEREARTAALMKKLGPVLLGLGLQQPTQENSTEADKS
jgi:hypothetical protein